MKYTKSLLLSFLILAMSASALAVGADVTIEDSDGVQRPVDSLCVTGESISEQCKSDRSEYSFDLGNSGNYEFSITDDNYEDKKSTVYVWEDSQDVGLTVKEDSNNDGSEDDSSFTVNVDVEDTSGINRPMDSVTVEQDNGDWTNTKNDVSSFSLNVPESGDYTFTIEDNRYDYDSSQINLWNDGQDVNLEVEEKNNEDSNEYNTDTSVDNVEVTVTDGSGIRRPMDQITVEEVGGSWEKTRTGVSSFNFDTPDSGNYRFSIEDDRFSFESKTINIWQNGQDVNLEVYSNQNSDDDSEDGSDNDGSQSDDSENENTDYSVSVDVKDDSGILRPVDKISIESDSGVTLDTAYDKSQVDFNLDSKGNYDLEVNDDKWDERSGSVYVWEDNQQVTLTVERKNQESENPSISLRDPYDGEDGVSRNPMYEWRITDIDEYSIDDTTLYVEEKDFSSDEPWNQPEHKYDVSDDVDSIEDYKSSTTLLDEDQEYVWGIEVESDGESYRSEVFSFTTRSERDQDPRARFDIDDRNPDVEQWVYFDASDSDGNIEEYRWDFGDGDTYTDDDPRVRHRYNYEGEYTVELTVEEYDGDEDTETKTIDVGKDEEETNSGPDVSLVQPGNNQRINLPYSLRWDVSDPENDDVDSTVYVARDRSSQSIRDGDYILRENVGESESFRLYRSDLGNRDYKWRVKATDEHGKTTWSGIRRFEVVRDRDRTGNANLNVYVDDEDGDPIRDARVVVDNENWFSQETNNNGEARFVVQSGSVDITVSKDGYRTSTRTERVSPDEDRDIYVTLRDRSESDRDEQARLDVHVEDDGYDELEDARVTVENGDDEVRYTDSDGDARFYLDSDSYDIEVECNNEEEYRSVYLSEGERESIDIRFDEDFESDNCGEEDYDRPDYDDGNDQEGLAITDVSYPNSVCRGGSFNVDMRIENRGGFHELVSITGSGLGSINTGQSFSLDVSETKSANLRFTNVEGSGQEEFTIRATNHDSARTTRSIDVRDCTGQLPDTGGEYNGGTATGITAEVSPKQTVVGKAVQVKGYVDGVRGRSQITIRANDERKATVSTQPDGYYVSYIRLDQIGDNIVEVSSGDAETESVVEVVPTSTVSGVSAPDKVFEGENYEVCADIESQIDPKVLLMKNGKIVDTTYDSGEVCFDRKSSDIGEHDYNIKTLTYGRESSGSTTTTEVLEVNSEVTNFPDKVATTESEEGMVKVELYNTHNDLRRYNVRLNGLESTWLSQTEKEVILNQGERETVYFYLTPEEEGNYNPTVEVSSRDGTIFSQEINVYAGGTKNPKKPSLIDRLGNLLSF